MNQPLSMKKGEHSHVGKVREENQDRVTSFPTDYGELHIVADGMGGHRGGATAASMVVNGFEDFFRSRKAPPGTSLADALCLATRATNQAIFSAANAGNPETTKMGSTVVVAVWRAEENELVVGHVGDSRAYLFRDGALMQITHDHSLVQRYIDAGMMSESDGRQHPDSGVLTRSMGQRPEVEMDVKPPVKMQEGDAVLLCSDGLCGYVEDEAIAQALNAATESQDAADRLLDLALKAGGEDNVSIQVLQFGARKAAKTVVVKALPGGAGPASPGAPSAPAAVVPPAAPPVVPAPATTAEKASPKPSRKPAGDEDHGHPKHRLFLILLIPTVFLLGMVAGILLDHFVLAPPPAAKPAAPPPAPAGPPTPPAVTRPETAPGPAETPSVTITPSPAPPPANRPAPRKAEPHKTRHH
ncbi:MAG: serine/threonine-protein phosphatase [Acidobacteria bacterium]|nr:serine/threonine-protein phosphatase [Acidobacteriota bacterium]